MQLWAMSGYSIPESWKDLSVPAKVKANQQRIVTTFLTCNIALVMQLQVKLLCGDFKLAGFYLNDCTALAAGRHRQNLAGFWQPTLHSMLTQRPFQDSNYSISYGTAPDLEAQVGSNCIYHACL